MSHHDSLVVIVPLAVALGFSVAGPTGFFVALWIVFAVSSVADSGFFRRR